MWQESNCSALQASAPHNSCNTFQGMGRLQYCRKIAVTSLTTQFIKLIRNKLIYIYKNKKGSFGYFCNDKLVFKIRENLTEKGYILNLSDNAT